MTALYKCKFSNQTRSEKQKNVHNGKKTNGKLQQKEDYNGKQNFAHYLTLQGNTFFQ